MSGIVVFLEVTKDERLEVTTNIEYKIVYRCQECLEIANNTRNSVCYYSAQKGMWRIVCGDCIDEYEEVFEDFGTDELDVGHYVSQCLTVKDFYDMFYRGKYQKLHGRLRLDLRKMTFVEDLPEV